jgi:hypothetical protein
MHQEKRSHLKEADGPAAEVAPVKRKKTLGRQHLLMVQVMLQTRRSHHVQQHQIVLIVIHIPQNIVEQIISLVPPPKHPSSMGFVVASFG